MSIEGLCRNISYDFTNKELLEEALTHPSLSKDNRDISNYERLEFLGDKALSLVIADFLMRKYKKESEGDLSKRQAYLVSGETLSKIASEIGIGEAIRLSSGEKRLGGSTNKRNLENALEALIGAIYLDSGYEEVRKIIIKIWEKYINQDYEPPHDPVSKLQELVQVQSKRLPEYNAVKIGGSDHSPIFTTTVKILHLGLEFKASGKSKKEAQREAAKIALEHLLVHNPK